MRQKSPENDGLLSMYVRYV